MSSFLAAAEVGRVESVVREGKATLHLVCHHLSASNCE
jgi:hypothetical protein